MIEITKSADISPCGTYRYCLKRTWSGEHALPFVMLNPSTADAEVDDPTIRRCMGFARREGAGGIIVVNAYGLRATDPKELWACLSGETVGPDNNAYLHRIAHWAACADLPVVCAWGGNISPWREVIVIGIMIKAKAKMVCLGKTKNGHPRHPLYVRGDAKLEAFP